MRHRIHDYFAFHCTTVSTGDIKCSIRTLRYSTNYDIITTAVVRNFSGLVLLITTLYPTHILAKNKAISITYTS